MGTKRIAKRVVLMMGMWLVAFLSLVPGLQAQDTIRPAGIQTFGNAKRPIVTRDSLKMSTTVVRDTTKAVKDLNAPVRVDKHQDVVALKADTVEKKEHNPNVALVMSAILPGAGQVYNRQTWKIPIIYGVFAGVGGYTYYNYVNMKQCKDEYLYRVNHDGMASDPELADKPTTNIYNMYESYNKTFQLSVIIGVAAYSLNLLDAYIFGHLFDFDIGDDLSMTLLPSMIPYHNTLLPSVGITFQF